MSNMIDFTAIRKWSQEKCISRVEILGKKLANVRLDDSANSSLDELIVIYLEILNLVIKEKKWKKSPLDMFIGVYGSMEHPASSRIFERFLETKYLVERFKRSNKIDKGRLRPQLVLRGML